jgi:hypothetical protein
VTVLPPISTEGLTTAHVDELAKTTHQDMVQVLKDISVRVDDPKAPAVSEAVGRSSFAIGASEMQQGGREKNPVEAVRRAGGQALWETGPRQQQRQRTISATSGETEDEGAVLVRRPG